MADLEAAAVWTAAMVRAVDPAAADIPHVRAPVEEAGSTGTAMATVRTDSETADTTTKQDESANSRN